MTIEPRRYRFPAAYAQERIWFVQRLDPDSSAFVISAALDISGRLDAGALRTALDQLVARHESLRTSFDLDAGQPVQWVWADATAPLTVIDLAGLPDAEVDGIVTDLVRRQSATAFDLTRAPLLRVRLVRLPGDRAVLLLAVHHIVCDGLSVENFVHDLAVLYQARIAGTPADLPELAIQPADFAVWQRDLAADGGHDRMLDGWCDAIADVPQLLDLPFDRRRRPERDNRAALLRADLPAADAARLAQACQRERISPFMLLMAAYSVVLARAAGQARFLVGTPTGGRSRTELAGLVGCFINMLVIPVDLRGDPTVTGVLDRIRGACRDAYRQEDLPFEKVVQRLAPRRDLSRAPLTQVLLSVQEAGPDLIELGDITLRPRPVPPAMIEYDLVLDTDIGPAGWTLSLQYATALFDTDTATRLLDGVTETLRALATDPDAPLATILGGVTLADGPPPEAPTAYSGEPGALPRNHLERALLDCFRRVLGRHDIGIHDDFFAAGGTSLTAARLVTELPAAVGFEVPLRTLFGHADVAGLAAALETADGPGDGRRALDLALADAVLPDDIRPDPAAATGAGPTGRALVTGANGFLGAHLVAELLATGAERVFCLVRAESPAAAQQRMVASMRRYGLVWEPERAQVVHGDLTEPRLGLSAAEFASLAEVDVVYHAGAEMNFVLPYRALRASNVLGTAEILRLACLGRPSAVHYVSTIDSRVGVRLPEAPGGLSEGTTDGYVLSKKTAEHLVLEAAARGLTVGVYRPWLITGATGTGAVNLRDQLALCLAGSLICGLLPERTPQPLHVLPVDHIATSIVRLAGRAPRANPIHQFYNPQVAPMPVIQDYLHRAGQDLRAVPFEAWRVQLARRTAGRLEGLAALFAIDGPAAAEPASVETGNAAAAGLDFPPITAGYVQQTVDFLVAEGLVPEAVSAEPAAAIGAGS